MIHKWVKSSIKMHPFSARFASNSARALVFRLRRILASLNLKFGVTLDFLRVVNLRSSWWYGTGINYQWPLATLTTMRRMQHACAKAMHRCDVTCGRCCCHDLQLFNDLNFTDTCPWRCCMYFIHTNQIHALLPVSAILPITLYCTCSTAVRQRTALSARMGTAGYVKHVASAICWYTSFHRGRNVRLAGEITAT